MRVCCTPQYLPQPHASRVHLLRPTHPTASHTSLTPSQNAGNSIASMPQQRQRNTVGYVVCVCYIVTKGLVEKRLRYNSAAQGPT